jgi:hypothetical protein
VDAGDVAGVPGGDEVDDDVPRDERNPMVTTAASIFSRGGSRGQPEVRGATMSFGFTTLRSIFCGTKQTEGVRRCAWTRGRRHEGYGKAGLTGEGEFGRRPLQVCGAPSSDSAAARR